MLDFIRRRKSSFISFFVVMAVVVVMAFFGIGTGSSKFGGAAGTAAWVNGEPISYIDFKRELDNRMLQYQQLFGAQYDEKLLEQYQIPQRILDELIQYKLLAQQSKRLDILVPDEELADYIRSIPDFQKNGKFDPKLYTSIPNRGLHEKNQRERMLLTKMQSYLSNRIRLTPKALESAFLLRDTKVDVTYGKINLRELSSKKNPPTAFVQSFRKETPEDQLRKYYDSHLDEFQEKASVRLKQIRVGVPFKATEEKKAEAQKKIKEIVAQVNADNFSAIAKKHSDDEYAKKGGDVGWVLRGSLESALEQAINGLDGGQVSPMVETSFGFFILQVVEKKDVVTLPFETENVKAKIVKGLAEEKYRNDYAEQLRIEWEDKLAKSIDIESDLKKNSVEVKKTGPFSIGQGYIPNIGAADSILDAIFELSDTNRLAKKLYYHDNHYYFIKLNLLETPRAGDFEKNQEAVSKNLETTLQSELLTQWISSLRKNATIKTEIRFAERVNPETMVQ